MRRVLLLLALALVTAVPLAAQTASRIDLVLRGVPARDALASLAESARMDLVYSSALVPDRRVWCGGEGAAPEAVLSCITQAVGLDFVRRSSGTYVLVERVERAPQTGALAGRVVDAETGEALPYAHVVLRDARTGAAADASGAFAVAGVVAGPQTLTASYVGYTSATQTVQVAPGRRAVRTLALTRERVDVAPVVIDGLQARPVSARLGAGEWAPPEAASGAASSPEALGPAVSVLGVAPPDFRDGLSIQGGETGEHLIRLDGATVYEPLALGTALSAMSPLALSRVTVRKAGFGARHGSFLAGVLDAEHAIPASGLTAEVTPLAATASGAIRQRRGQTEIAVAVTARRSLWEIARPGALDDVLREWNTVDPVLASAFGGAPMDVTAYDVHRHGSDVTFSDLHGAARVRFGALRTLNVSAYRGASEVSSELFASGESLSDPAALIYSRDRYHWTNTALSARYSWLAGPRLLLGARATASGHTLTHAFEQASGDLAGLSGNESVEQAEASLRQALDTHDGGDDGNRLGEVRLATTAEVSLAPGHTFYAALEATGLDSRFHLNSTGPTAVGLRALDADARLWRLALALEDELALGRGWTAEPGVRLTLLPDGATLAEPRAALRLDRETSRLGAVSARLAAGIYRQFAVRYDLATVGPSALVPDVSIWVPTDGVAPPLAAHLTAETFWAPREGWAVRAEGYLKAQPRLLTLDYAALLNASPEALTRQSDWVLEGEGRAAGVGVRIERQSARFSVSAGYAFGLAERRFGGRFEGAWTPAAWEEPHAATLAATWAVLGRADASGLTVRARGRGVWGRSWAFRRAYYEVLAAHSGATTFAPFDLSRPGADALPAWLDLDLGVTLRQRLGPARLEVTAEVTNALDRANALDWWLRPSETGNQAVTRAAPGLQPSLRVRLAL